MTDWSDLETEARKRTREVGPRCQVEVFLSHQDEGARWALEDALKDPNLTTVGIQRALTAIASDAPGLWSIGNHRRRKCRCSR